MKTNGILIFATGLVVLILNILSGINSELAWATGAILMALSCILFELESLSEHVGKVLEKKEGVKEEKKLTREACGAIGGTVQNGRCSIRIKTKDRDQVEDIGKITDEE